MNKKDGRLEEVYVGKGWLVRWNIIAIFFVNR
jgi:hypothetical protein